MGTRLGIHAVAAVADGKHRPADLGRHDALGDLHVADLDASVAELRGKGVDVTAPSGVGTGRQSFLHDPSGNRIELHQPAIT